MNSRKTSDLTFPQNGVALQGWEMYYSWKINVATLLSRLSGYVYIRMNARLTAPGQVMMSKAELHLILLSAQIYPRQLHCNCNIKFLQECVVESGSLSTLRCGKKSLTAAILRQFLFPSELTLMKMAMLEIIKVLWWCRDLHVFESERVGF